MSQLIPSHTQLINRHRLQVMDSSQLEAPLSCTSQALVHLG